MTQATINFGQFIADATKTESIVPRVNISQRQLAGFLLIAMSAANILDLAKRKIFYGNDINFDDFDKQANTLCEALGEAAGGILQDGQDGQPTFCLEDVRLTRLLHGAIGKFTESGEIIEAIAKHALEGKPLDGVNLGEELADDAWYTAVLADVSGLDMQTTLDKLIAKLKVRFKDKFDATAALNRDLAAERVALES